MLFVSRPMHRNVMLESYSRLSIGNLGSTLLPRTVDQAVEKVFPMLEAPSPRGKFGCGSRGGTAGFFILVTFDSPRRR